MKILNFLYSIGGRYWRGGESGDRLYFDGPIIFSFLKSLDYTEFEIEDDSTCTVYYCIITGSLNTYNPPSWVEREFMMQIRENYPYTPMVIYDNRIKFRVRKSIWNNCIF